MLILLDYYFGPIQCDWTDEEGRRITRIPVIDSDEETQRLNKEANALWLTLFAPELLSMIEKLIARLEQIKDGTYIVEDRETPRLKALIESK